MFDVNEIGVLYNLDYIGKNKDSYVWDEKQRDNPDALAKVTFVFKGGTIGYLKSDLLKKMQCAYRGDSTIMLNFRRICDGLLFLDRGNDHYFVVLEVKSGFGDVKKKAIGQIPASYVKAKSILHDFLSYNKSNYKEFGLIVSYPHVTYSPFDSENNPIIMEHKRKIIEDKSEIITSKYNDLLLNQQSAVFLGSDFEFNKLTQVNSDLFFDKLIVKHCPVANKCIQATVDLDKIISTL